MWTAGQCDLSSRGVAGMLSVLVLAYGACIGAETDPSTKDEPRVETWVASDMQFRRIARERPRPEYPGVSVDSGRMGVAVAEVVTTSGGSMGWVEILEAPDEHTGDALVKALAQWEVQPPVDDGGRAVRVRSKLFFYFLIEDGEGFVRSPEEMLEESATEKLTVDY